MRKPRRPTNKQILEVCHAALKKIRAAKSPIDEYCGAQSELVEMSFDEDIGIPGWEPEDYITVGKALSAYFENRIDWKARPPEPPAAPPTPPGVPSGAQRKTGDVVMFRPRGQNNPKWFSDYMSGKDTSGMTKAEKKKAVATGVATTAAIRGTTHIVKKKLAQKAALKVGAKIGAKAGAKGMMKFVPGIGWAIMAADAAPEAWAVAQESASAQAQALRDIRDAKGVAAKGKAALTGGFNSWKRGVTGSARVGAAAFVGSDVVKMGRESWAQNNDGTSIAVRTGGKVAGRVARKLAQRLAKSPGLLGTLQRGAAATPKYLKAAEGVFLPVLKSSGKWLGIGAATVAGGATVVATTKATLRGLKQNPRPSGPIVLRFIPHPTIATWIGAASQKTIFEQMHKKLGPLYDTSKGKNSYGQWVGQYPVSISSIVTDTGKRGVAISVPEAAGGSIYSGDQYLVAKRWFDNLDKEVSEWRSSTGYIDMDDVTVSSRENPRQAAGEDDCTRCRGTGYSGPHGDTCSRCEGSGLDNRRPCEGGCGKTVRDSQGMCRSCSDAEDAERGISRDVFGYPINRPRPGTKPRWAFNNPNVDVSSYIRTTGAPRESTYRILGSSACDPCSGTGVQHRGGVCRACGGSGTSERKGTCDWCQKQVRESSLSPSISSFGDICDVCVRSNPDEHHARKVLKTQGNPNMAAFIGGGQGLRVRDLVQEPRHGSGPHGGYTPAQRDALSAQAFLVPERRAWPVFDKNHCFITLQYMSAGRGKRGEYPQLIRSLARLWPVDDNADVWADYSAKKKKIERQCGCVMPSIAQLRRA